MCVTHKSREKGVREKKIVGYRSVHSEFFGLDVYVVHRTEANTEYTNTQYSAEGTHVICNMATHSLL